MKRLALPLLLVAALVSTAFSLLPGGAGAMEVDVQFERTFNLFPQSPVRVRGVEVGMIQSLDTSPGSDTVTTTLRLEEDVDLPADVHAVIVTSALLGERYVQLQGGESEERLQDGDVIPVERTIVPFEFDEVLEGLNDFVGGLEEDEVARLVTNLANLLEGNGAQLGSTIDAAGGAIAALKENDEELLELASAVSDLNETIATRDQELAQLLRDWIRVTDTLTSETTDLDGALEGLVTLTRELAELLIDHRVNLSEDIDTLTRVARTSNRNLDQVSTAILGAAELFRHAERVVDRDTNMLPLVNHAEQLVVQIEESVAARLAGLCLRAGGDEEECSAAVILPELQEGELCLEPIVPCASESTTVADVLTDVITENPDIGRELLEERAARAPSTGDETAPADPQQRQVDEALRRLGLLDEEDAS